MKELVTFLIKNITGSDDFTVSEENSDGRIDVSVSANPEVIGLIIGKEGKTIKNIRKIASIKASLENSIINISVTES